MNPLEWNKWLRILYCVIIGFGFILGGRFWKVLVKLFGLNQFFNLGCIRI
jgi:hypothetical protein